MTEWPEAAIRFTSDRSTDRPGEFRGAIKRVDVEARGLTVRPPGSLLVLTANRFLPPVSIEVIVPDDFTGVVDARSIDLRRP